MCIIGLALMGFHTNNAVRYFGVFLATAGANTNVPVVMVSVCRVYDGPNIADISPQTYQANNIRGQWKRAFCSATLVGMGGVGGIVGSTVFRAQDAPTYVPGLSVAIGSQVIILFLVGVLTLEFVRQNQKADRGEKVLEQGNADFRYTY